MVGKIMYIANDDTQNKTFCKLKLVVETFEHLTLWKNNQNSLKVPTLLSQLIRKRNCKTLGTSVINRQISPPSMGYCNVHNTTLQVCYAFIHLAVFYTSPQSFIITFCYSFVH